MAQNTNVATYANLINDPERVKALQRWLNSFPNVKKLEVDGIYGPLTTGRVIEFQRATGISEKTGIADAKTLGYMSFANSDGNFNERAFDIWAIDENIGDASEYKYYRYHAEYGACWDCTRNDLLVLPVWNRRPGDNFPPIHPNCKCWIEALDKDHNVLTTAGRQEVQLQIECYVNTAADPLTFRGSPLLRDGNVLGAIPRGTKIIWTGERTGVIDGFVWARVVWTDQNGEVLLGWVQMDYLSKNEPPELEEISISSLIGNITTSVDALKLSKLLATPDKDLTAEDSKLLQQFLIDFAFDKQNMPYWGFHDIDRIGNPSRLRAAIKSIEDLVYTPDGVRDGNFTTHTARAIIQLLTEMPDDGDAIRDKLRIRYEKYIKETDDWKAWQKAEDEKKETAGKEPTKSNDKDSQTPQGGQSIQQIVNSLPPNWIYNFAKNVAAFRGVTLKLNVESYPITLFYNEALGINIYAKVKVWNNLDGKADKGIVVDNKTVKFQWKIPIHGENMTINYFFTLSGEAGLKFSVGAEVTMDKIASYVLQSHTTIDWERTNAGSGIGVKLVGGYSFSGDRSFHKDKTVETYKIAHSYGSGGVEIKLVGEINHTTTLSVAALTLIAVDVGALIEAGGGLAAILQKLLEGANQKAPAGPK